MLTGFLGVNLILVYGSSASAWRVGRAYKDLGWIWFTSYVPELFRTEIVTQPLKLI